jgi:hypothetical protein
MTDKQQPPERVWLEFFDDNVRGVSVYVPEWHDKTPITYRLERIKQNGFPYALVHPASEQCDLGTCSRPSDCRYYCIERHARVCVRPRNQRQPNTGTCEHGISWSMECLSCGHSDFVAARVQPVDEARVESLWRRVNAVKVQIANDHHVADQPTWADVHYLLSLLPQLSSSEIARCIQERAVKIRKAGNDSGNERDQQFIEGGISALEVLADDIEDGTFPVSSSERGNEQRHPRMTPEDHRRIQETLDSLPEYPTEEEAESYLQACGTSGKEVVNQFIERLLKERLEFKEEVERLRVLLSSSERRCPSCGHAGDLDANGICQTQIGARNWEYCQCKCVFPATVAVIEGEEQHEHDWYNDGDLLRCYDCTATESAVPTATTGTTDGFDTATAHATTAEGLNDPWIDANGHAWERRHGIECVECPDCGFTFAAMHKDGDGKGYSCPNCGTGETAPAGVEAAAKEIADWITQTTPLTVGDALRSSIQRIIFKHCAAPVAAESSEVKRLRKARKEKRESD